MLSKNKIKFFNSLKLKKFRIKNNLFLAEGEKLVFELLQSEIKPKIILTTLNDYITETKYNNIEIIQVNFSEIKKISQLKTPPEFIGIFEMPYNKFSLSEIENSLNLFCDDIQNPGNLGTIIRTADWFGIENIICSENTVDAYNPKTIQATMGAIASVKVHYVNKEDFFSNIDKKMPVYGTFLEGENIYNTELTANGLIVIGNEGQGISEEIVPFVTKKLFIPSYNTKQKSAESLNASIAAAVVCAEFKRKKQN